MPKLWSHSEGAHGCRVRVYERTPGGWRSINTMKRSYQQADDAGVMEAVMEPRRLRDGNAS